MISKKLYIIIITVFVVFFVVMFGMFGIDELRKEGLDLTIIMGNRSVWKYNNKKQILIGKSIMFIQIMNILVNIIYGMMMNGMLLMKIEMRLL